MNGSDLASFESCVESGGPAAAQAPPRPPFAAESAIRQGVALRHVAVPTRHPVLTGLRIAHVSDLHFRRWSKTLEATREALRSLDYDFLAITGDFAEWPFLWRKALRLGERFFAGLTGKAPIFAILGNHDHENLVTRGTLPIRFLRNEAVAFKGPGGWCRLAGLEQMKPRGGDLGKALGGNWEKACRGRLDKTPLPSASESGLPTILLAHYPSTVYRLKPSQVSLLLAGHTHGGQIRFPRLGCLWSNDRYPARHAWGLHTVNGTPIHVSAGVGTSLPLHLRFNCPPEVTLLEFADC